MVRMLSIYLLVLFAVAMTWYITNQLKDAYASLKDNGSFSAAKPIFLLLAFVLFTAAGAQSFFESPEDIASHILLIITTILLSFALAINKASLKGLLQTSKRYTLKLKMIIAYQLIKFGKRK
ncbi:hypothetical protein A9Q81_19810 [Gammaproteobacteria bacterium 42_54_T18]|nr:hypothetical protein A9Q81_19810 [Gammaproteobacteria bacterium 42_54_T18]